MKSATCSFAATRKRLLPSSGFRRIYSFKDKYYNSNNQERRIKKGK